MARDRDTAVAVPPTETKGTDPQPEASTEERTAHASHQTGDVALIFAYSTGRARRAGHLAFAVLALGAVMTMSGEAEAGSRRHHKAAKPAEASPASFFDMFKVAPAETKSARTSRAARVAHAARPAASVLPSDVSLAAPSGGGRTGIASFYGGGHHGGPTASGERFNQYAMTAAHRSAPLGSSMRVTNLSNGRSVVVRINDRGPFVGGRIIDLSKGAAQQLGFINAGLAKVRVEPML